MRRLILLAVFLSQITWAYSSLVVSPEMSGVLNVPAVAPFTSLGDYRMEFRIHDWTAAATGNNPITIISFGSGGMSTRYLEIAIKPPGIICASDMVDDVSRGRDACADLTGHNDVIVRLQRFGSTYPNDATAVGSWVLEAWDIDGTPIPSYCHAVGSNFACPITAARVKDWSAGTGYVGQASNFVSFSLAWLKWFSATVPPGSPFSQEATPADLADWRFEGDLANEGAGGYKVSIGSFNKGPFYGPSTAYAPTCQAGPQQVFRAGYPAQLDGSNSYALNGDPSLSYLWQTLSGPTKVRLTGLRTAQPTAAGTAFGSYIFQLTVTDSGGQSSTCTVKHGFVATDDSGVVLTGNAPVDTLLGPMVRYGANPWPWFDDRHKAAADLVASSLNTYYRAFWDSSQEPGTVAFTTGSKVVTGSDTAFTTTFCQGPDNPTVPKANAWILLFYPNSSDEGYGLRNMIVASCESDTQLTMTYAFGADVPGASDCSGGGCRYSYDESSLAYHARWVYPIGEGSNYYDAVAGLYALYYRTGLDEYLTAARTLADRFWKYRIDSGLLVMGTSNPPRVQSLLGMVLRALDGKPDMWPGLRNEVAYWQKEQNFGLRATTAYDIREQAYAMAMVSYAALFDPDETSRATAKAALSQAMERFWNQAQAPDGSFQQCYTSAYSWTRTPTSVTLQHGSTAVKGNGTSWTSKQFPNHIVFLPTSAQPLNYAAQTERTYYTAIFVDSTHLVLDRPYEGTTGTHGWMIGYSASLPAVGWGAQPFIEGILGMAFDFTAQALSDTDPANAARARTYVVDIANWLRTKGYRSANNGMQYMVGTVDCPPPIDEKWTWCTANNGVSDARTLNAESLRAIMLAYSYASDPNHLAFADTLYNAMWAKAGYCPADSPACIPDGRYITSLNDGLGWYMSGDATNNKWHKYFGMFFGIGAGADWPAYRAGGPQSAEPQTVYLAFNLGQVTGATQARVTTTAPDGKTTQTLCPSSPCAVAVDGRQGDHIFVLEYLSAGRSVLAATELPAVQGP